MTNIAPPEAGPEMDFVFRVLQVLLIITGFVVIWNIKNSKPLYWSLTIFISLLVFVGAEMLRRHYNKYMVY